MNGECTTLSRESNKVRNTPQAFLITYWYRLSTPDIDECASFPCRNGGTCTHGIDVFYCDCAPGWTGTTCEEDIDECLSAPCINGACTHGTDFYFCTCDPGWTDMNCDVGKLLFGPMKCVLCMITISLQMHCKSPMIQFT